MDVLCGCQRVGEGSPEETEDLRGFALAIALPATDFLLVAGQGCWFERVLPQGILDALSAWAADSLVDRECLPQVGVRLAQVAVLDVSVADSFQGARFL
jgi:hypothetical protein